MVNQIKDAQNDVVIQSKFNGLREFALFAGAGGGILGGKLLGWQTICAVERELHYILHVAPRCTGCCIQK